MLVREHSLCHKLPINLQIFRPTYEIWFFETRIRLNVDFKNLSKTFWRQTFFPLSYSSIVLFLWKSVKSFLKLYIEFVSKDQFLAFSNCLWQLRKRLVDWFRKLAKLNNQQRSQCYFSSSMPNMRKKTTVPIKKLLQPQFLLLCSLSTNFFSIFWVDSQQVEN